MQTLRALLSYVEMLGPQRQKKSTESSREFNLYLRSRNCLRVKIRITFSILVLLAFLATLFYLKCQHKISSIKIAISNELNREEILMVKKFFKDQNHRQNIRNLRKFGPINEETNVIVIRIHDRFEYIHYLLERLSNVQGIENSLLIFSQDIYIPNIIEQIWSIKFARVLHIFYPFSIQLYPSEFPGDDPKDCCEFKNRSFIQPKCNRSQEILNGGECREGKWTQPKHHFWWMMHFVFEKISVLKNFEYPITILEDDFYVTDDFFWVLKSLRDKMTRNECDGCNVICPGWYFPDRPIPDNTYSQAVVTPWLSNRHNMGVTFNRTLWKQIKACKNSFCNFNDYNHDWSLLHLSLHCLEKPMRVILAHAPRIFHAGSCGMHFHEENCDPGIKYKMIERSIKKHLFFPSTISIQVWETTLDKRTLKINENGFGRWQDHRDRTMCLRMDSILESSSK